MIKNLPRWYFFVFSGAYCVCLIFESTHLSLWLDEIIQLIGTRDFPLGKLIRYIAHDPGQVPLGYLVQSLFVRSLGFSVFTARLPSIIFGLIACFAMNRISGSAALVFCLLPLQVRYAVEARPYGIAVCFSVLALAEFIKLDRRWNVRSLIIYLIFVAIDVYLQPFSIFVVVGCALWAWFYRGFKSKISLSSTGAVLFATLVYLPWLRIPPISGIIPRKQAWQGTLVGKLY